MWSLGALLFGHLTRNCRCSHCPGINSNYALHSDGFCASRPPASSTPPPSPPSTPPQSPTHLSPFSLPPPPPPPPPPSHTATGELIWLLEHPGPIMNELTEICTFRGGKGGGGRKEMHIPEVFLEHYLSSAQNNLCMSSTQSKVWNAHLHICAEKYLNAQNCLGLEKYFCGCFCNCDTVWKNTNSR